MTEIHLFLPSLFMSHVGYFHGVFVSFLKLKSLHCNYREKKVWKFIFKNYPPLFHRRKSVKQFGLTCGWANNDTIVIFGWTITLMHTISHSCIANHLISLQLNTYKPVYLKISTTSNSMTYCTHTPFEICFHIDGISTSWQRERARERGMRKDKKSVRVI